MLSCQFRLSSKLSIVLCNSRPESSRDHLPTTIAGVLRLRAIEPSACDGSAKRFAQDDGMVWGLEIQLVGHGENTRRSSQALGITKEGSWPVSLCTAGASHSSIQSWLWTATDCPLAAWKGAYWGKCHVLYVTETVRLVSFNPCPLQPPFRSLPPVPWRWLC
jgi:hypothetical protein